MPSVILAGTTTGTALSLTSDTSGELQIRTNNGATTALTLTTGGAATFTAGTVSAPAITTTGDANTGIFFPAADTIAFTKGGVESMRITGTGNVGINTNTPGDAKLFVQGIVGEVVALISTPSTGTTVRSNNTFRIQSEASGRDVYMQFSDNIANATEIGMISGSQYFCTNSAERMRIDSSGNLLVGATTPSYSASNRGLIEVNGVSESLIAFKIGGGATNSVYQYNTTLSFETNVTGARACTWTVNGAERMRIDSSGNLLVGTTSPLQFTSTFANPSAPACVFYRSVGTAGAAIASFFSNVGGTASFKSYVDTDGTYTNISDARTKKNVEQLNLGIDIVSQLNPVSFNWLSEENKPKTVGFIAQEVESVYPQAVTTFDASDSNGFADQKMMKNDALFPLLVKAIQELKAELDSVKAELQTIKGA